MEDIERFIKIMQQRRLSDQHKLESLDAQSEHKKLMKELQDLRREREQCTENISKHLSMITAHKHSIHKIVHSSKNISGLPIPHDYAQDMATMFTDSIEFLNNMGDIYEPLTNIEGNNVDPLKLIQAVTTCTEAVGNELYETKCNIARLDTLKENIDTLQFILNNSDNIEDESLTISGESMDSQSTIKL